MNVLVLGGYGLVGLSISRQLASTGLHVIGLGRSALQGRQRLPDIDWVSAELNDLTRPDDWLSILQGIDVVVNASGALQTGPRDDLVKAQRDSISALIECCERTGVDRFIQISAPGAAPTATTEFLSTKGDADAVLRKSALSWVILKPGLVLSETSTGGTNLLRMLSSFPVIQPIFLGDVLVQTVSNTDVAAAVARCIDDTTLNCCEFDLVESQQHTLKTVVLAYRRWHGFKDPAQVVNLPTALGEFVSRVADLAGYLGWRAPLRTTVLEVLEKGVLGDPKPWRRIIGKPLSGLSEILRLTPATRQDRLFARLQLLFPLMAVLYALFWLVSGVIGLVEQADATALVSPVLGEKLALFLVIVGSIVDVVIGIALLIQRSFERACYAAVGLSLIYLCFAIIVTPELWIHPLGPMVKVIPVILLGTVLAAMATER